MAQKPVDVTVNPGVGITVDVNKVSVKKGTDTIAWKSTKSKQEFGIVLPAGEPAVSCDWQGNKWVCTAGPFNGAPRTIKYDVTASGTPTLDPDVEVIP
ncbi:MAG: hypothetical protein JO093_13440 [Acidobacteria bacterium]|nr:hypothetical protein [Acidobacteriota bacterium]MBV9069193.1 hypothetical protein [Acidobacteriota bacterium]MBV9186619.1 hypothetical protein [Acidobacteriota bacterium]